MKVGNIGLTLNMKHKSTLGADNVSEPRLHGTLRFTVTPTPAFSTSERGKNVLELFPGSHPSNLSPGIFTTTPDSFPAKESGGEGLRAPESQPELSSILDFNRTFKEPDEFWKPEPLIRQVFRVLKTELRLVIPVGVRHPVRYAHSIRSRRQIS
ncbi:hypothetical protein BDR07DRAFT_1488794 [Suillus spraguei]|nr:hypothetical protein BDR07DRAFT_1488794 [Suillus spraguei]